MATPQHREPSESGAPAVAVGPAITQRNERVLFDGHSELVKLDRLWQLYWHVDLPAARQVARLAVKVRGWVEADGVAAKQRADIVSRFGGLEGLHATCINLLGMA